MKITRPTAPAPLPEAQPQKPATQAAQQPTRLPGDAASLNHASTNAKIPAQGLQLAGPAAGPITPFKGDEVASDLHAISDLYDAYDQKVLDFKVGEGGKVSYQVLLEQPETEPGVEPVRLYSNWTGQLVDGKVTNRRPTHDLGVQTGGDAHVEATAIGNIRVGLHTDEQGRSFERVVIDISRIDENFQASGKSEGIGAFDAYQALNKDGTASLYLDINGIRGSSAVDPAKIKGTTFSKIEDVPLYDGSAQGFKLDFKQPVEFKAQALTHPGRLVLDIYPPQASQPK